MATYGHQGGYAFNEDQRDAMRDTADQKEPTLSDGADRQFASIVGRIRELEKSEQLLGEVLATLAIERNREQLLENPAENLPMLFQIADKWMARKRAIGFPDGQAVTGVALA